MGIRLQHQSRALTGLRLLSHELPAALLALLPPKCAPRDVLQLDFKVHGFVYCEKVQKQADRSVSAICRTGRDREDLGAWMLTHGRAVALPGAPIEYVALERFARMNGRGFWGFQVDTIR